MVGRENFGPTVFTDCVLFRGRNGYRSYRGHLQTLLPVWEVDLIACTPLILPLPQSSVYSKTQAIRCHAVKNAWSQFCILLNVVYEFNKRNIVYICFLIICNFFVFIQIVIVQFFLEILFSKHVQVSHVINTYCLWYLLTYLLNLDKYYLADPRVELWLCQWLHVEPLRQPRIIIELLHLSPFNLNLLYLDLQHEHCCRTWQMAGCCTRWVHKKQTYCVKLMSVPLATCNCVEMLCYAVWMQRQQIFSWRYVTADSSWWLFRTMAQESG